MYFRHICGEVRWRPPPHSINMTIWGPLFKFKEDARLGVDAKAESVLDDYDDEMEDAETEGGRRLNIWYSVRYQMDWTN
jgi:hypothetical protein